MEARGAKATSGAAESEEEANVLELPAELLEQIGVEVVQVFLGALLVVQVSPHQDYWRSCAHIHAHKRV